MFDNYCLMEHQWFNRSLAEETFKWDTEYEKPLEKTRYVKILCLADSCSQPIVQSESD